MSLDPAQMMEIAEEVPATAGRDVTYLLVDHLLQFDAQGRLTERVHYVYRVDRTREHGPRGITAPPWHPWFEGRPTGGARVIRPDGSVTALDLATLVETTPEPGYLMYQDTHELEGPLPGVTQGAIVEEVWTIAEHRPFSLAGSGAAFGLDSDAELLRVRVEAPASRPLRWAVTGRDAPEVVKRRDGDLVVLELTASHLPPLPRWAGDLPLETALERRLEISAAASWSAVADAWRGEAEAMIDPRGWEDVVASVRAAPDRNAAITIATRAVQADIQYVGLELGSRSIVPWKPSEVRARGFGDCKDQATTVVAILRAAGIAADIALLRRGYDTEPAELLPNAGHFNHAIVYVPQQAGKPAVWVDVTNPEVAIGDLPADDQDRWALVTAPGTRNVVRTPVFPASHRVLIERDLTTPGVISGKTTSTTSGWLGSEAREPAARNATVFTPAQASERTSGLRYGRLLDWSGEVDPRAPDPLTTWATWTWDGVPALGSTVPISFDEDLAFDPADAKK